MTTRPASRRAAATLVAAVLAGALAACSDGVPAVDLPTYDPSAPVEPRGADGLLVTTDEATAALPVAADLPGWTDDEGQAAAWLTDRGIEPADCAAVPYPLAELGGAGAEAGAFFRAADLGPFAGITVRAYEDLTAEPLDTAAAALARCGSLTIVLPDGQAGPATAEALPLPDDLGDQAYAVRLSDPASGQPAYTDLVVVRVGRTVVTGSALAFGAPPDRTVLATLVAVTLGRLGS